MHVLRSSPHQDGVCEQEGPRMRRLYEWWFCRRTQDKMLANLKGIR